MVRIPPPPATWQEDLKSEVEYYQRFFNYRLRFLRDPDLREEQVQEAMCQVALTFYRQWERYGKRSEDRFSIARCILSRVKKGRSCTRKCNKNGDAMDRSFRTTGTKREQCQLIVFRALRDAPARPEIPADTRLDLQFWLATLPAEQRAIAADYPAGLTPAEVAKRHGFCYMTAVRWRHRLETSFAASRE